MSEAQADTARDDGSQPTSEVIQTPADSAQADSTSAILVKKLEDFQGALGGVTEGMKRLLADFDAKIKYDQSKDRVIDTLHNELQVLRNDLVFKILQPIASDLVQFHDDMDAFTSRQVEGEGEQRGLESTRQFLKDIQDILDRFGFELYRSEGDSFDRALHRAIRAENTNEAELDMRIAQRLRLGLRYGERILRPEYVVVYKYVPEESQGENSMPEVG